MAELGKMLVGFGLLLILIGGGLWLASRYGLLPLGRLPGDFSYRGKKVQVYFPLGTSILISIILTVVFYVLSRFRH